MIAASALVALASLVAAPAVAVPPTGAAQPGGHAVVAYVTRDAWQTPGAAVAALAETEPLPANAQVRDLGDLPLDQAVAALPDAASYVLISRPRPGRLGGVAVYPGSGLLVGSTRRAGLVTVDDVRRHLTGERPFRTVPGDAADVAELARRERLHRPYHGLFHAGLITFPMLLFIGVLFGRRRAGPRTRAVAVVVAAYPAAGFVSSLLPWWRFGWSGAAALLAVALATAAVAGLGALVARPLRTPAGVGVAAVTAAAFVADLVTGGYLQETGIGSYSAVAAGRFHGLGNTGFAILATAAVVVAGAAALRYGRWAWLALVPVVLVVALPVSGADFGGAITLTAVLVAAVATRARRAAVVAGAVAGLVLAGGVAWLDYRRAEPTHLGRFVGDLLTGGWTETLARKARAAASSVATFYPLLVAGGAATAYVLRRRAPASLVLPLVLLWTLGSLVNDSGLVVAAAGLAVAVPMLVAYEP